MGLEQPTDLSPDAGAPKQDPSMLTLVQPISGECQ